MTLPEVVTFVRQDITASKVLLNLHRAQPELLRQGQDPSSARLVQKGTTVRPGRLTLLNALEATVHEDLQPRNSVLMANMLMIHTKS